MYDTMFSNICLLHTQYKQPLASSLTTWHHLFMVVFVSMPSLKSNKHCNYAVFPMLRLTAIENVCIGDVIYS